jgi:hypothetical protein
MTRKGSQVQVLHGPLTKSLTSRRESFPCVDNSNAKAELS